MSAIVDKLYSSANGVTYSFRQLFEVVNEKNKKLTYSNVLSASQELGMIERSDINKDIKFEQDSICGYKIVRNGDYVVRFRLSIVKMEVWNDKGRDCCRVWLSETVIPDADTIAYDRIAVGAVLCTRKKPAVRMTGSFSCVFFIVFVQFRFLPHALFCFSDNT